MLEVFDKIKEIWKTITSINKRLEALEKIHTKGPHPGFICPSCGKTTVRVYNEEKTEMVLANYVTNEYTGYCHEEMTARCTNKKCSFMTKDQDFIKKYFFHL